MVLVTYAVYRMWRKRLSCKGIRSHHQQLTAQAPGVALGLLTVPAAWWVFSSIGRNVTETVLTKADHALVTTGPYRWIRHPLYTMGGTLFVAVGLMSASWFILGVACLAVALLRVVVVPREEQALVAKFGDEYRAYMNRTGGLVPSVSIRRRSSNEARHVSDRR